MHDRDWKLELNREAEHIPAASPVLLLYEDGDEYKIVQWCDDDQAERMAENLLEEIEADKDAGTETK